MNAADLPFQTGDAGSPVPIAAGSAAETNGAAVVDGKGWTWHESAIQAKRRLAERGFGKTPPPAHRYRDLGEIEAIEQLGDHALANMSTRHLAWYAYATEQLAEAKSEHASLNEMFEMMLGNEMARVAKTDTGRMVKDVLRGVAIDRSEDLKKVFRRHLELMQDVQLLEGAVKSLEIRCRALEAEAIRRASSRRVDSGR